MDRNEHWLNPTRLRIYPRIILAVFILTSIAWLVRSHHMIDPAGKPIGCDFIIYWSASRLALAGHAVDAYSIPILFKMEQIAVPGLQKIFTWHYPPPFYLIVLPFGLMPYLVAYPVFMMLTGAFYVFVFRRIARSNTAMWCLAAFSGFWICIMQGQNAFLTAGFTAAALLCLKRRPLLAGVFIGLLTIKPHLALLFPVALIAIGAWRTLIAAAATSAIFTGLGTAVFGMPVLKASIASLAYAKLFLETGMLPWSKMPTVFTMLRIWHVPVREAYILHSMVAVVAAGVVWYVWRRSSDWQLRSACLMTATYMISPYVFDYDLAGLAFPIVWLTLIALRDGWLSGEREALVGAWLLPFLAGPLTSHLHVQVGPFVFATMLSMIVRRAKQTPAAAETLTETRACAAVSA